MTVDQFQKHAFDGFELLLSVLHEFRFGSFSFFLSFCLFYGAHRRQIRAFNRKTIISFSFVLFIYMSSNKRYRHCSGDNGRVLYMIEMLDMLCVYIVRHEHSTLKWAYVHCLKPIHFGWWHIRFGSNLSNMCLSWKFGVKSGLLSLYPRPLSDFWIVVV